MTARITRRFVDEYTFRETIGIEFIRPRGLEDSILDDQLAAGFSYRPPRDILDHSLEAPPAPSPSEKDGYRPPTPPKTRDKTANSPRKSPLQSPDKIKAIRLAKNSPLRNTQSLKANLSRIDEGDRSGQEQGEDDEGGDCSHRSASSVSEMSNALASLVQSPVVKTMLEAALKGKKMVRFADENELNEISKLQASVLHELFYASEELAEFRYEAFMEEAGLDPSQFD